MHHFFPSFLTQIILHLLTQIMTLKGGTSQACAACKYQRKRCTPECALAPHFRPEQTEIFKNAHKLFGVRNILRILEQVDPAMKNEAMRSIIYQANMRDRSPVHGCLGVIYQLQYQIRQAEKELYTVFSQLELYKQNQRRQQEITLSPMDSPESQQLQLGMGVEQSGNPGLTLFQNEVNDHTPQQPFVPVAAFQISYSGNENGSDVINVDSKDSMNMNNVMWGQQICYNENNDKSQMVNTQPLTIQDEVTHDYDEIYPFFDTIDDTQSYIDSKEANESSSDSSQLKEATQSIQHVAGNTLKNAQLQVNKCLEIYGLVGGLGFGYVILGVLMEDIAQITVACTGSELMQALTFF
ncbi:LOB domain-containing protein 27 [Helianthus annuus]|uniref:LOB domain-containing protein 27 n=1 Tax=Helianthus annuus TaxID=4232 RepID=UPI001652C2A6|nr:LOB domain-containing protein 27 [Helianthus annuus]